MWFCLGVVVGALAMVAIIYGLIIAETLWR